MHTYGKFTQYVKENKDDFYLKKHKHNLFDKTNSFFSEVELDRALTKKYVEKISQSLSVRTFCLSNMISLTKCYEGWKKILKYFQKKFEENSKIGVKTVEI